MRPLRIAIVTTDNREHFKNYAATEPYFGTAVEALLQGLKTIPDIEVHVVSCLQKPMESPAKLADNIWYHGLVVPKIGWMRTFYSGCVLTTRKFLRELAPDIVHGQGTERECAMVAVMSSYPNVLTLHGIMSEMNSVLNRGPFSYYWLASQLEKFALRRTGGVLCNSRFTEQNVREKCNRTWLVPNALQQVFFDRPLPEFQPAKCTLLNVGTVCTHKRQNELLDVLRELREEGLSFEVEFIGAVPTDDDYGRRFLDRVQSSPHLSWGGFKGMNELIDSLDQASALVHVSKVETFGLVVAEALSRNLKFFGFGVGGIADIAKNAVQSDVFPDGDWSGLKNAISKWIKTGAPRPTTAAIAIRDHYHPRMIAERHLEIYREVLKS
jgi:glycosyltransferase involved in cell wall biosynthesis